MQVKQMTTREKILKMRALRQDLGTAFSLLSQFVKEFKNYNQTYDLGTIDRDSLEVMNELKIQFATEEILQS